MRWPNGSATRPHISSHFGLRSAPKIGASTYHRGTDFTGFNQVRAVAAGRVVRTGTPSGWYAGGRQVWIQHDGYFTKSLHLSYISVANGAWVEEGDVVGIMGATGTATGIHLHFELTLGTHHLSNVGQIDAAEFIANHMTIGSPAGYAVDYWKQLQFDLNRIGYSLDVDGIAGPLTIAAVKDFQAKNGLEADGIPGPLTRSKLTERLKAPVGHNAIPDKRTTEEIQRLVGENPDGEYGPATTAKVIAWQTAHGLTADGIWGPASDAKGFPPVPATQWPTNGRNITNRPTADIQRLVGASPVDGDYGPITSQKVAQWQAAHGLTSDGVWGPASDAKGFPTSPAGNALDPAAPWKNQTPDSGLATWVGSPNYNYRPAKPKTHITDHWMTGTLASCDSTFQNPGTIVSGRGTNPSSVYGVGPDAIHQYVKESDYVHSDGNTDSNATTISIEHEGGWPLPDGTRAAPSKLVLDRSVALHVDIARRHGWKRLEWMVNVFPHKHFTATECPGSLDTAYIIAEANKILAGDGTPDPDPIPEPTPVPVPVPSDDVTVKKSTLKPLWEWLKGIFGG